MIPYLFLVKTTQLDLARDFYTQLGFVFEPKQSEDSQAYYAANLGNLSFELFPCQADEPPSNNRLGFELPVDHPELATIAQRVQDLAQESFDIGNGKRYTALEDPDGRCVEIVFPAPTST